MKERFRRGLDQRLDIPIKVAAIPAERRYSQRGIAFELPRMRCQKIRRSEFEGQRKHGLGAPAQCLVGKPFGVADEGLSRVVSVVSNRGVNGAAAGSFVEPADVDPNRLGGFVDKEIERPVAAGVRVFTLDPQEVARLPLRAVRFYANAAPRRGCLRQLR